MDHHSNQVYYVLDHKTERIRDVYTLGRMLGQSHFGTTYFSTEIATRVDYACKSISKRKLISKEDLEDAMKEILLLHHLARHKNMVTIKGVYEDPLYVHIVMEHCNGGELFDRIIHREQYTEKGCCVAKDHYRCCVLKSGYDVKVLVDTYDVDCVVCAALMGWPIVGTFGGKIANSTWGIHLRMKQDYQLKAMWTAHVSSVAAAAD
ncbi:calcium-dependent protein kinase 26 [Tanacetum coccineum]